MEEQKGIVISLDALLWLTNEAGFDELEVLERLKKNCLKEHPEWAIERQEERMMDVLGLIDTLQEEHDRLETRVNLLEMEK